MHEETDLRTPAETKARVQHLIQVQRAAEAREVCALLCERYPEDWEAWSLMAAIQGQRGDFCDAELCCRKALRLSPGHPVVHYNLALALLNQDRQEEAIIELNQAVSTNPDYVDAYRSLGRAYWMSGDYGSAVNAYERVLHLRPREGITHTHLARLLANQGRWEASLEHYLQALEREPDLVELYSEIAQLLGGVYQYDRLIRILEPASRRLSHAVDIQFRLAIAHLELGETGEAQEFCQRTLEIDPDHVEAKTGLATILVMDGKYAQACEMLDPLLERAPDNPAVVLNFAYLAHRFDRVDEAIQLLKSSIDKEGLLDTTNAKLHIALGRLYDRRNEYGEAFRYIERGNDLNPVEFDPATPVRDTDTLIQLYSDAAVTAMARASNISELPVFIVGMPRSGSSLVEQILASHPAVCGGGELKHIHSMAMEMHARPDVESPYPFCMQSIGRQALDEMADGYLAELVACSSGATRVTDKLPVNYMHLGLISQLLPKARIINCVRDPMDTCLSCYFQFFSGYYPYTYDLSHLGLVYRCYEKLMAHWKRVLPLPILDVRYEELINNQEAVSRSIVEFCGLGWDRQCLEFHNTDRTVATASYEQVRQPIYSGSVGKWKHYEKNLQPLKEALGIVEQAK